MIKARKNELRNFALLVGGVFVMLGVLPLIKNSPLNVYSFFFGVFLIAIGMIIPQILAPVYSMWMKTGHLLGKINSFIILSIIYYSTFTPMRVLKQFFSKESIFAFKPDKDSYWRRRKPENHKKTLERQF